MTPMSIILEAAYYIGTPDNYSSVPAPTKDDPTTPWFYDLLAFQMEEFAKAGITDIVIPNPAKAQGGSGKGCDGFGMFDPYDISLKHQQGSIQNRFGPFPALLRLISRAHRFGLRIHFSVVSHQRDGMYPDGTSRFIGADGTTQNGRWQLNAGCFVGSPVPPWCDRDSIMGPTQYDYSFGLECANQNCRPEPDEWITAQALDVRPNYMIHNAQKWLSWLFDLL